MQLAEEKEGRDIVDYHCRSFPPFFVQFWQLDDIESVCGQNLDLETNEFKALYEKDVVTRAAVANYTAATTAFNAASTNATALNAPTSTNAASNNGGDAEDGSSSQLDFRLGQSGISDGGSRNSPMASGSRSRSPISRRKTSGIASGSRSKSPVGGIGSRSKSPVGGIGSSSKSPVGAGAKNQEKLSYNFLRKEASKHYATKKNREKNGLDLLKRIRAESEGERR